MTPTQTLHCIFRVAAKMMPERYEYEYGRLNIDRVQVFTTQRLTDSLKCQLVLPGILRDIAESMGVRPQFNSIMLSQIRLGCELSEPSAIWQIMHYKFGSDYCAGIEKEVCECKSK